MLDVFPLAENANRMLGCKNVEFLDWPDGGFLANQNNELLCGGLLKKIMEYNPSAIFYPHCYDNTEDHRAVCLIMKKMMQHLVVKQFMYCVWLWDDTPWKELMKLRSVNALVLKSENNYKSNAVDYYVNSSVDGVRLSGNLPVLFTKMIKQKTNFILDCKIMVPKIIHYCWFGGQELPDLVKKCIETWHKYLPDYEFKLWNEESFDINSSEWCKWAYEAKKYAFVADYVRLVKLYEEGGIYLDTDEKLEKSLNRFVENDEAFMGFEDGKVLSMGVMGFPPKHKLISELMQYYKQPFTMDIIEKNISNAVAATNYLEEKYGLKIDNSDQIVSGVHIYPRTFFNAMDFWGNWDRTDDTTSVHLYMGSWLPNEAKRKLDRRKTWWWRLAKTCWNLLKGQKK